MNILNQPGGNPVFPSKVSGSHEPAEHAPTSLSLPGTNPAKVSQSSLLKQASYSITTGGSRHPQSSIRAYSVEPKAVTESDIMNHLKSEELSYLNRIDSESFTPSLVNSLLENDKLTAMDEVESYKYSSFPRDVLIVSVSSAVELNSQQIELITRKMQKLTGFRRLKLVNTIDPSLIAGFVIDYSSDGSGVIDLSVKGQLAILAAKLETSDQKRSGLEFP